MITGTGATERSRSGSARSPASWWSIFRPPSRTSSWGRTAGHAGRAKLLEVARRYNVPVASCNTAYMNEREMPYWKITAVRETFRHDHPSSALDPRIHDPSYDLTVCKKAPSIFFETGVSAYFVKERIDTVMSRAATPRAASAPLRLIASATAFAPLFRRIASATSRSSRTGTISEISAGATSMW